MRGPLICLMLLAAVAEAQNPRPAQPVSPASGAPAATRTTPAPAAPAQAPTPGPATQPAAAQAAPVMPPGVQAPGETAVPGPQMIGWIRSGQSRNGQLELADYRMGDGTLCDVWYLDGTAGQRLTIELRAQDFDSYMQLLDPYGAKLAETQGRDHDVRITFQLPAAGRYQIVVNSAGNEPHTGRYALAVK